MSSAGGDYAPAVTFLADEEVLAAHKAALQAQLDQNLSALRAALPQEVLQHLTDPSGAAGADVVLSDLRALNAHAKNGDPGPLAMWLRCAQKLCGSSAAAKRTFTELWHQLRRMPADEMPLTPPTPKT